MSFQIKDKTSYLAIVKYAAVSVVFTLILSSIASALILTKTLNEEYMNYLPPVILFISVFFAITLALHKQTDNKFLISVGVAAVYFLITLLTKKLFFDGPSNNVLRNVLLVFGASLISAVATGRKKSTKRYNRPKKR